jgi:DNA helicase HerA-like ATPase
VALSPVRRLAKRGLKRGVTILGSTQRVSDVSKGVTTQLKNKVIGGADADDAPRALKELGLPPSERAAVMELHQGHFQVKGPAFSRHAVHVRVPLAETSPPKRRRGDPPAPAAEAPAAIAQAGARARAGRARARSGAGQERAHVRPRGAARHRPGDPTRRHAATRNHQPSRIRT